MKMNIGRSYIKQLHHQIFPVSLCVSLCKIYTSVSPKYLSLCLYLSTLKPLVSVLLSSDVVSVQFFSVLSPFILVFLSFCFFFVFSCSATFLRPSQFYNLRRRLLFWLKYSVRLFVHFTYICVYLYTHFVRKVDLHITSASLYLYLLHIMCLFVLVN